MTAIFNEITKFFQGLRPLDRITVSQWADKYRFLSPVSSAESGQYRTSRTPYLRDIMDCLSVHDSHRKIVFVKAAQIGGTEGASNFVGYAMHIAPAPTMFVQPTDKMVERLSKGRIDPLIENCPELKQRVAPAKSRDSNNTITQKNFSRRSAADGRRQQRSGVTVCPYPEFDFGRGGRLPAGLGRRGIADRLGDRPYSNLSKP